MQGGGTRGRAGYARRTGASILHVSSRLRTAALLLALPLPACLTQHAFTPPLREEKLEVVREKDGAGHMVREQMVLRTPGERPVSNGYDKGWYPDGSRRYERAFDHGRPKGTWRTWHPNGQLASETVFAGPEVETPMRFWFDSGVVSAEGPARNGSRCGTWRFLRPDGSLQEEGGFTDSFREGEWVFRDESGTERRVTYRRGVIVPLDG